MNSPFANIYEDPTRADAYAGLEFPGTYYLAFRDLPTIFAEHCAAGGRRALDFGCGAGRSSRFLKHWGYEVVGVDISEKMLAQARVRDPEGDYRLVPDGDLETLADEEFDVILAAFPFDNIPTREKKVSIFRSLRNLLARDGRIVNVASAPELYLHEWVSFTTQEFPQNHYAREGDKVHLIMLDVPDRRPVDDIFCTEANYREIYRLAGLAPIIVHRPLGEPSEPFAWLSERTISPWGVYVLERAE